MIYSPVLITTINRYTHFRKCLESLEACTGALETDVFVALDYPPSEKYLDGWSKIDSYLRTKEKTNNFKKLTVIRREYNYGLSTTSGNSIMLKNEIIEKYNSFIVSEDDNVFSPNFLEYINKGLELYKNNKDIYAIVGYNNSFDCKHGGNNHFAQFSMFQAWGYATWKNRFVDARESLTPLYFKKILFSKEKWKRCYKYWPVWFDFLIRNARSTQNYLPLHDINLSFYILNEGKYVICPTVSKVRNTGFDNEATTTTLNKGSMAERAEIENNLSIDQNVDFEFVGDPFCYVDDNSYNTAIWDQKWEGYKDRGFLHTYLKVLKYRLMCLGGVI